MESRLYFSVFVLSICAIHLVWTASAWVDAWWRKNMTHPKKMVAAARNGAGISKKSPLQRSDWYAFFHCSDLVGKDPAPGKAPADNRNARMPDRKISRMGRIAA